MMLWGEYMLIGVCVRTVWGIGVFLSVLAYSESVMIR